MRLSIRMDIRDFLSAAAKMSLEGRLPEFVAKTLAAALRDKIETNIHAKIGTGKFGTELAGGIRTKPDGSNLLVDHVTNDTNHLAEHVQDGGVIRPRERKYLAIPLMKELRGESPEFVHWRTPNGEPVWLPRKRGPGWVMLDYVGRKKNRELQAKFALVPETKPQRPRPYWPTDQEVVTLTEREIAFWLKKALPESI